MAEKKTIIKSDEKQAKVKLNLLEPRATEKTYREQTKRTYAFFVKPAETKQSIASRVQKDYNVTVTDVRVLTRKGKRTKYSKGKHAYPGIAYRYDRKLAYVTLKDGDSIKVFEVKDNADAKKANESAGAKASEAKPATRKETK
ncbi:50S ribosomal protein L23 [Candidatus Saccharibacteria bacterium]|nr:50S ribosomal protein L23 [Candidatus Saccharibacteria bacterium]